MCHMNSFRFVVKGSIYLIYNVIALIKYFFSWYKNYINVEIKEPRKKRKLSGYNEFQKEFWKNIKDDGK